jgi:hypothetical protein
MKHGKNASESIEPMRSEINLTDALPHTPKVGLRELGSSILNLPRLRAGYAEVILGRARSRRYLRLADFRPELGLYCLDYDSCVTLASSFQF